MLHQWMRGSVALLAALLLALAAPGCDDASGEIERTLDELRDASLRHNGEAFASLLAPESFGPYTQLIAQALDATPEQVSGLSISQKVDLVMMRNRMKRKDLAAMDGRAWVVHAVNQGWYEIPEQDEEVKKMQTVKVRGNSASVETYYGEWGMFSGGRNGEPIKDTLGFIKVEDRWLYDFRRPAELFEVLVTMAAEISHATTDQVLERMEGRQTGKDVNYDIWKPMK